MKKKEVIKTVRTLLKTEASFKLKPFDKSDWYAFAGAEEFGDGTDPLIWDGKAKEWEGEKNVDIMVIIDGTGVAVFDAESGEGYLKAINIKDKNDALAQAKRYIKLPITSDNLKKAGFKSSGV